MLANITKYCQFNEIHHEFISRLIVVINSNNNLGVGCCFFKFKHLIKFGKFLVAFIWLE